MAKSLPPLASKGLALSLLVLALLAAAELTVAPLWRLHQAREARVDALREQALRFERLAAEAAARGALLQRLEQQRSLEALAFSEPNPALAAAALQGRLKSIVAQAGGKLLSTQAMPAVETGAYHRIAVRARLQASGDALPEIVYGIESAYPYLFVDEVTVAAHGRRSTGKLARAIPPLDVRVTITSFAEREADG